MDEFLMRQAEERQFGKIIKVLYTATILYRGWEMDNEAWVVEMSDGSRALLTTSHGGVCQFPLKEAEAKLVETLKSAESIRAAIKIIWPDFNRQLLNDL